MNADTEATGVLRIGVLGAARIARGFALGVRGSTKVAVVAIASRSAERAAGFAAEFGIARSHGSYQALLDDPGVDAIYNALPNGLHAEWSIAATRAGKHVLCEKPLACDEAQGRAMLDAARAAGVTILEAFPYHFQPQTVEMQRVISDGTIGAVLAVQASFGFLQANPGDPRFDPALGGGALLDVGCYPVSLARLAFGSRPLGASAVAVWTETGVDQTLAGTLEFAGGGIAQIYCSFAADVPRRALIAGTTGVLETDYRNHTDRLHEPTLRLKRGPDREAPFEILPMTRANGFRLEAEALADEVAGTDPALGAARSAASLDNLAALAALLESARARRPVAIPRSHPR